MAEPHTDNQPTPAWEIKAHKVIESLSFEAWRKANTNPRTGQRYAKHRQYVVPQLANDLVNALGIHDDHEREKRVKALLLEHAYRVFSSAQDPE